MPESLIPAREPRSSLPAGELWQIPGIMAAIGLFILAAYIAKAPSREPQTQAADFQALLQAYESHDTIVSASSSQRFLDKYKDPGADQLSAARFILADSKWTLTRNNPATTRKDLVDCLVAYEKARLAGLTPTYEATALSAQADIFLRLGQTTEALDAYTLLLGGFPDKKDMLLRMALAYVGNRPPLVDKARECVDKYLACEGLSPGEIRQGYLTKAQIAVTAKDYAGAVAAAKQVVAARAGGEQGARATLLLAQGLTGQGDYAGAIATIDALGQDSGVGHEAALTLARAIAAWKNGDIEGGRKALDDTIFKFPGTSEALSARYELARLLFEKGGVGAARDALVGLLDDMSREQVIATDCFDIDDITALWFSVGQAILEQKNYGAVHDFHSAAIMLMPAGHFLFFDATLYLEEAEQQEPDMAGQSSYQIAAPEGARKAYLEAGNTYAKVLATSAGDLYRESLYSAGYSFYRAGEYARALEYLRKFTGGEFRDPRLPKALYEQASCLAALGNYAPAVEAARRNVRENPHDIYAYHSILLQADIYRDMGGDSLKNAADIYGGILTDEDFDATSFEWRRSIFALGETLYNLGDFKDAVLKLDEALTRFPDDPEAANARYCLGLACRKAAFADPASSQMLLQKAAKVFADVMASSSGGDDSRARNAAFLEADCYYDMGDYTKALSLYDKAVEANVDTPEATRALFQIATCYHRLGMKEQADATYKRALFNLRRRAVAPAPGKEFYESLSSCLAGQEKQG